MKLHPFTVLLLYPDYSTDNFGEIWLGHVRAPDATAAVGVAQRKCRRESTVISRPDDLLPISVFEGHHRDLVSQWAAAQSHPAPQLPCIERP